MFRVGAKDGMCLGLELRMEVFRVGAKDGMCLMLELRLECV